MTTIATTIAQGTTVDTFVEAAATGTVKFYTVRENGTFRHIPFLAEGTEAREVAEWVADQREQGITMKAIATEMHVSVPSVRRTLNSLLLTQDVEDYDSEDIEAILAENAEQVEAEVAVAAQVGPFKADGTF